MQKIPRMMAHFETRSVSNLLERNLIGIKDIFTLLEQEEDYEIFVEAQEKLLQDLPDAALKELLDGHPILIGGESETKSLLLALRYAYLLTRYAQIAIGGGSFEKAMFILAEASHYAGFAQGVGQSLMRRRNKSKMDSTASASHAARSRHSKAQDPVKQEIIRLLELQGRDEKWSDLSKAINSIKRQLDKFLILQKSPLEPANLALTVGRWHRKDAVFHQDLGRFVKLKEQPSTKQ